MPAPSSSDELLDLIRKGGLVDEKTLDLHLDKTRISGTWSPEPSRLASLLVRDGVLTFFQAEQLLGGKWRRFFIGKYKVLERIGSGDMGTVYFCEHSRINRAVAVKVLPTARAGDSPSVERFYREARALAALQHANVVRGFDIDQDGMLHFIVMEYVNGSNLQHIVLRGGPMNPVRAAHYISQAALGLQHAHESAGIVHRDIEPRNILVDRLGTVKIVDFGLACFANDKEDILAKKYDGWVFGTPDYIAPEQVRDCHSVDIRADIYGLGATFYFCLTGRPPFNGRTEAEKLACHLSRRPRSIPAQRLDVPEEMVAIVERMMAKDPAERFQTPQAVAESLVPWTQQPIDPPEEDEMPQMSPAAMMAISRSV